MRNHQFPNAHRFLPFFTCLLLLLVSIDALKNAVRGKRCAPNQVVNKLTVYEDGAIEAECGPLPCGSTGICSEDLSSCKAASEVFSGMKWARNGQSLLMRCCALQAANKVYIGTDLVTLGSYYTGGLVPEKDMMGTSGAEFDYVANVRTEQGGVRVWVYRVVCPAAGGGQSPAVGQGQRLHQKQHQMMPQAQSQAKDQQSENGGVDEQQSLKFSEVQDAQVESQNSQQDMAATFDEVQNPLQYRPKRNRNTATIGAQEPVNRVL